MLVNGLLLALDDTEQNGKKGLGECLALLWPGKRKQR